MARSSTSWKAGEQPRSLGGPTGPRLPLEIRRLKDEAKAEVLKSISNGLLMSVGDLQTLLQKTNPLHPSHDPSVPVVDVLVAAVIGQCIKHGDMARFSLLINYVMGKPKPLDHSWHDPVQEQDPNSADGQRQALKQIPSDVLVEIAKRRLNGSAELPAE